MILQSKEPIKEITFRVYLRWQKKLITTSLTISMHVIFSWVYESAILMAIRQLKFYYIITKRLEGVGYKSYCLHLVEKVGYAY